MRIRPENLGDMKLGAQKILRNLEAILKNGASEILKKFGKNQKNTGKTISSITPIGAKTILKNIGLIRPNGELTIKTKLMNTAKRTKMRLANILRNGKETIHAQWPRRIIAGALGSMGQKGPTRNWTFVASWSSRHIYAPIRNVARICIKSPENWITSSL